MKQICRHPPEKFPHTAAGHVAHVTDRVTGQCASSRGHPAPGTCPPPVPPPEIPSHFPQVHLLALCSLEVHVAVALPALGGGPELPQPVGLGGLGQANVSEGSRRGRHFGGDPVDAYKQNRRNSATSWLLGRRGLAGLEQGGRCGHPPGALILGRITNNPR